MASKMREPGFFVQLWNFPSAPTESDPRKKNRKATWRTFGRKSGKCFRGDGDREVTKRDDSVILSEQFAPQSWEWKKEMGLGIFLDACALEAESDDLVLFDFFKYIVRHSETGLTIGKA